MTEDLDGAGQDPAAGDKALTEPSTEKPGLPAVVASPEAPPSSRTIKPPPAPKTYRGRFLVVYAVLGLTLIGAAAGAVVLYLQSGPLAGPAWSNWKPESGTTAKMASSIADHVAQEYHLNNKAQLVAVVSGPPKVTSGTKDVKIAALAIRKKPNSNAGIQVISTAKTWTDQLCGLGPICSIESGQATAARGRLVRREALEVALYTFKFVPAIDTVVAFMPPPPGQTTTTLLFLQKANLKDQLKLPLVKTLKLAKPPLPTNPDMSEKATIDKLTLPAVYSFQLAALQAGGAALILDPVST